jgi:DNA-3-methyladenine glycosylase II
MNYKVHLQKDVVLATILNENSFELSRHENIALRLMASIMSQQLSTKVAAVIYKRFLALFDNENPNAVEILKVPNETIKAIGLSNNKVAYIKNVAQFCLDNDITDAKLETMDNEAIIQLLTQIKGVGQWTVEMLLMFSLGREDVFAEDDLGIQQGMQRLYLLEGLDKKKLKIKMLEIANNWKPFRSFACLHIWKWKDAEKKKLKTA